MPSRARESGFGLIVAARPALEAAGIESGQRPWRQGRVVGVNVRELLEDWPPRKWAADDDGSRALASDPGELRLLWFSTPDADGWFRLTATDSEGRSWSTYCRTPAHIVWHTLENALAASLQQSLDVAGDVALGSATRAPT